MQDLLDEGTDPLPGMDDDLVRQYRAGDQRAAAVLYRKYAHRLLSLARSFCGRTTACRFDPEDVVQSVFRILFTRLRGGTCEVPDGGELWGFLMVAALGKVRNLVEYHTAQRRSVRRTNSADATGAGPDLPARPSPDVLLRLVLQEHLAALPAADRPVVERRLEGYEVAEIAHQTGRSLRSVERVLHNFRAAVSPAL
jgi:RNA polymerase sigma-70 factor, ECF subfamily